MSSTLLLLELVVVLMVSWPCVEGDGELAPVTLLLLPKEGDRPPTPPMVLEEVGLSALVAVAFAVDADNAMVGLIGLMSDNDGNGDVERGRLALLPPPPPPVVVVVIVTLLVVPWALLLAILAADEDGDMPGGVTGAAMTIASEAVDAGAASPGGGGKDSPPASAKAILICKACSSAALTLVGVTLCAI